MPQNLRAIRRKVRTVRSIWKITRAMKMVAAARLRRIQGQVDSGRAYWDRLDEIIGHVAAQAGEVSHPLLEPRAAEPVAVVAIAGERGLCGSYNAAVLRHAYGFVGSLERPVTLITVGAKARAFFRRRGVPVAHALELPDEQHRLIMARDLSRDLRERFLADQVGEVHVVYTRFYSPIRHVPTIRQLLPVAPPAAEEGGAAPYLFEPPAEKLLGSLLPRALDAMVYEMLLQSAASEEGARMTAMTAATDNAQEMITNLTREFNRARQAQITSEILEVVGGANALTQD